MFWRYAKSIGLLAVVSAFQYENKDTFFSKILLSYHYIFVASPCFCIIGYASNTLVKSIGIKQKIKRLKISYNKILFIHLYSTTNST